jgi:hypothetical protein
VARRRDRDPPTDPPAPLPGPSCARACGRARVRQGGDLHRVGAPRCQGAPLTEPDKCCSHPALRGDGFRPPSSAGSRPRLFPQQEQRCDGLVESIVPRAKRAPVRHFALRDPRSIVAGAWGTASPEGFPPLSDAGPRGATIAVDGHLLVLDLRLRHRARSRRGRPPPATPSALAARAVRLSAVPKISLSYPSVRRPGPLSLHPRGSSLWAWDRLSAAFRYSAVL